MFASWLILERKFAVCGLAVFGSIYVYNYTRILGFVKQAFPDLVSIMHIMETKRQKKSQRPAAKAANRWEPPSIGKQNA